MKFSCDKATLQSAISTTARAVASKSSIPALGGVLLKCAGERLTVCGYNLTVGIRVEIPVEGEEDGEIVLDAALFGGIVSKMPDDAVTLDSGENYRTKLTCGNASFEISGLDAGEFPELPEVEEAGGVELPEKTLRQMIQQTSYAIGTNENHPAQTGALFEVAKGRLTVVSSDGFRVALRRESIAYAGDGFEFIVPGNALREAEKICADSDRPVRISVGDRHIRFGADGAEIICRRLEGKFIDYKKAIEAKGTATMTVTPRSMLESLERVTVVVNDKMKAPIRCRFGAGSVALSADTGMGAARDVCRYEGDGGDVEIGFNGRYLAEAMKYAPAEKVKLHISTPVSPGIIVPTDGGDSFLYLVLPVRLKAA